MSAVQDPTSKWLFSRNKDLAVFWGSMVAVTVLCYLDPSVDLKRENLLFFFFGYALLDAGHVLLTYFPITSQQNYAISKKRLYWAPVFVLGLSVLLFWVSKKSYIGFLGGIGLYHIMSQQYGWLAGYQRRTHQTFLVRLERFLFWTMTLFPILYWLNGYATTPVLFFHPKDLPRIDWFSKETYVALISASCFLMAFLQFAIFLKTQKFSLPKVLFIGAHFAWLYFGLLAPGADPRFFRAVSFCLHGGSYYLLIQSFVHRQRPQTLLRPIVSESLSWAKVLGVGSIGFVWIFLTYQVYSNLSLWGGLLIPVLATPLMTHYFYDTIIWRRRFIKATDTVGAAPRASVEASRGIDGVA